MKINYNLDHKLLAFPVFEEAKTTTERFVLLVVFSQIVHFSRNTGSCQLYKNQMAQDFKCHPSFFTKATKWLIKHKMIKELIPYDRKTQQGAVYDTDIGYISLLQKLYPSATKAVSQGDKVNSIKQYYKKGDVDTPPPSSERVGPQKKQNKFPKYN
mgnify:CR=1 FL=1